MMARVLASLMFLILSSTAFAAEPYEVSIDRALAPRMAPESVGQRVMERLQEAREIPSGRPADEGATVLSAIRAMSCARGSEVDRVIRSRMGPRSEEIVWVVEADGTSA
jgi:hypothetical protein